MITKYVKLVTSSIKRVGNKNKRKGSKMSKQTKHKLKLYIFATGAFLYVVGAGIVGTPVIDVQTIAQLAYYGIGGGLLFWVISKLF